MAKLDTLTDNFNDNNLASKWFSYTGGTSTVREQNARLEEALPAASTAVELAGIENDNVSYDFTSSFALVKIVQAVSSGTHANQALIVYDSAGGGTTNSVLWVLEAGTLYAQKYVGGVKTNIGTLSFDINTHKYWKLSEAAGVVTWATSTDGITFTSRFTNSPGITLTSVNVDLECKTYQVESNPGTGIFDTFNLVNKSVAPTGISSSEAFGTATVGLAQTVTITAGIVSAEALGTPILGGPRTLLPSAIDDGNLFGTPAVTIALLSSTAYSTPPKPTINAVGVFTDNFDDNSINTTLWSAFTAPVETNQQLQITSRTAANYIGLTSVSRYALTGGYVQMQIVDAGNQAIASWEIYPVQVYITSANKLFWYLSLGTLKAYKTVAGVTTLLASLTYNSTNHQYFRIREQSGYVYFEYSANGTIWHLLTSLANPFALTSLLIEPTAGTWQSETLTTTAKLDNFGLYVPPYSATSSPVTKPVTAYSEEVL